MKRAFNLAVMEWEWGEKNPVFRISKERFNNKVERWLSADEETRLLKACTSCNGRLRAIVVFALNTGMRQGEILDLRLPYVDLSRKTAVVMRSKNGERRTVPLNAKALGVVTSMFRRRKSDDGFVFTSETGARLDRANLQRDFRKAVKEAKVENFRFHDLRHTFATRLVQAGIDLYTIGKILGHMDIRMTQRYAHHCTESLRAGVEILDDSGDGSPQSITISSQSADLAMPKASVPSLIH